MRAADGFGLRIRSVVWKELKAFSQVGPMDERARLALLAPFLCEHPASAGHASHKDLAAGSVLYRANYGGRVLVGLAGERLS